MTRAHYPTSAAVARQIEAARKAGLDVAGVVTYPDGRIVTLDAKAARREAQSGEGEDGDQAERALAQYENGLAAARRP